MFVHKTIIKMFLYIKIVMTDASTQSVVTLEPVDLPCSSAMEYTSVFSIAKLRECLAQKDAHGNAQIIAVPLAKMGGETLAAPVTADGKLILFQLSPDDLHDISGKYRPEIRCPHDSSKVASVAIHIALDEHVAGVIKAFDEHIKKSFRALPGSNCPAWAGLVKEAADGTKTLPMEVVLDDSEVPTQILFIKGNTAIEGEGSEFLLSQIGSLENLKDYQCGPIAEFSWILLSEEEGYHRLRVKVHSVVLKKKQLERPLKRLKMSEGQLHAYLAKHGLPELEDAF